MNKAEMKIHVTNARTGEVLIDVHHLDFPYSDAKTFNAANKANFQAFRETNPDCVVHFMWRYEPHQSWNFLLETPINQEKDIRLLEAGEMSWERYQIKWLKRLYYHQLLKKEAK